MRIKKTHLLFCALLLPALLLPLFPAETTAAETERDTAAADIGPTLLPLVGGALVEARDGHWDEAAAELDRFEAQWKTLPPPETPLAQDVSTALTEAKQALAAGQATPEEAHAAISRLAKATQAYLASQETDDKTAKGIRAANTLLPLLQECLSDIREQHWEQARLSFKRFNLQWLNIEAAIRQDNRSVYGDIETKLSMARIALQAEPPKAEAAESQITALIQTVEQYAQGKAPADSSQTGSQSASGALTVQDAIGLLDQADAAIRAGNVQEGAARMQSFVEAWLSIEGAVQTRDPQAYTRIENQMTKAVSLLLSNPPKTEQASGIIAAIRSELEPYAEQTGYTAWDAAAILLREGLEALLILAALLAFLRKTGNASKQIWVWNGALAGLLGSALLAVALTYTLSNMASGSTREWLEGITGLAAVVLMLAVGIWLHDKSRMQVWNEYIRQQVGTALAKGNLWSLFLVAALAILREGAETAVFYIGLAPSIELSQLLTGIGAAAALLLLLGFAIVKGSARIPVRPLFLGATALIYYLVVKFVGESIHALQVAGKLPSHVSPFLPSWGWIGLYPTWETALPQLAVLLFILYQVFRVERKTVPPRPVHDAANGS